MIKSHSISLKGLLRSVLPPMFVSPAIWLRDKMFVRKHLPEFEYIPEGWGREKLDPRVKGWNVDAVREAHRAIWPQWIKTVEGIGTLGVDFYESLSAQRAQQLTVVRTNSTLAHNAVMSFAYSLALAARKKDKVSILDWGGGVGQYYSLTKALLPGVEIIYHCMDVPILCALGRELSPEAEFHEDHSWLEQSYDFVFASAAFQLSENWQETLRQLASVTAGYLLITRAPFVVRSPSFVVLQRGYTIFESEFLHWFLNRDEFLQCASAAGLRSIREFILMDYTPAYRAPEQAVYRGFLFQPT